LLFVFVLRRACCEDQGFQLIIEDLESVRELELHEGTLRLVLRDGAAVMTFARRQ
jgi:hypothetical protein